MPTITKTGIKIESLDDILKILKEAHYLIDPEWNLDPSTLDGQKLAFDAQMFSNLNEALQLVYQNLDPDTADREALINISKISGVFPQDSSPSTAIVTCYGIDGTFIPKGSRIRNTEDGLMWATNNAVTIQNGSVDVAVTCVVDGAIQASANKLTQIVDVVGGWTSVTNKASAVVGYDEESTKDLRIRRNKSVAKPGSNQVDSLYGEIANVDDVKFLKIYENKESAPDSNGLSSHSVAIYVEGGTNENVAKAIAGDMSIGTGHNKNTNLGGTKVTMKTKTPKGRDTEVTFFRPTHVDVYVEVEMVDGSDQDVDLIKQAIVEYSKGTLIEDTVKGFDKTGFDIGESVRPGKLYTPANRVVGSGGYIEPTIKIGRSKSSLSTSALTINYHELPIFNVANIVVKRTES